MTFYFQTLGCKLNFAESSALAKELQERGHQRTANLERADICILNTCSVTDAADHKGRQAINHIRRLAPEAVLIVTGCYAQLKANEIASIEGVDYVLGTQEKFRIAEVIDSLEKKQDSKAEVSLTAMTQMRQFFASYSKDDRTRCFIKVQDGCDYFCTYCTIPLARGRSRNASIESTVSLAKKALQEGARELIITGVNIGDFGKSTGESFIELLKALDRLTGDFRIRISSCEPNLLSDEIIEFVAQSRHFAPHFHIPLQSGNNQMLEIMHRRYTRELFQERVEKIRLLMPNAFIGVDCMVGVRGETAERFQDYYDFIRSLPVSQLHVFTYSERANTRMLDMELEVVPSKERKHRSEQMHKLSEEKLSAFYSEHKGQKAVVLWESKKEAGNMMSGFTENYIKQYRPYNKQLINCFEEVIIS